jgi:REP element-mobilizing transposase RayT
VSQTLTQILVHAVFSTKNRRDLIFPEVEAKLYAYIGGICRNCESPLLAIGGTGNHVHLLFVLSKNVALSHLIMTIKKDSSKWMKTQGAAHVDFHWQDGYGAFSVAASQRGDVIEYMRNQKEHHRTRSFEEELMAIARKCGVEVDPQYLWR